METLQYPSKTPFQNSVTTSKGQFTEPKNFLSGAESLRGLSPKRALGITTSPRKKHVRRNIETVFYTCFTPILQRDTKNNFAEGSYHQTSEAQRPKAPVVRKAPVAPRWSLCRARPTAQHHSACQPNSHVTDVTQATAFGKQRH